MGNWSMVMVGVLVGVMLCFNTGTLHAEDAKPSFTKVDSASAIDGQRADFNQSLKRLGFTRELSSCKILIKLHQDIRDESFGGICALSGTPAQDVLVCDDTMVGKFTLKAWGFAETPEEAVAFTQANCPGGG